MRGAVTLRIRTWALAALVILVGSSAARGASLAELDAEIKSLLSQFRSSIVTIQSYSQDDLRRQSGVFFPFSYDYVDTQIGTGVVYDDLGHIVTTGHVISGGQRFEVVSRDGKRFRATVVGVDPEVDLSVLRITPGQLSPIALSSGEPVVSGSLLLAVGNSFGVPSAACLATAVGYRQDGSLQVSASLAPGFSGGPIVNVNGEMVGMISAKLTEPVSLGSLQLKRESIGGTRIWEFSEANVELPSTGVILALPSSYVAESADRIIAGERTGRGFLGVQLEDIDPEWALKAFNVRYGVMISDVMKASPAWNVGVRTGDILTHYLGRRISNSDQLRRLIAANRDGDVVSLVVVRGGRNISFTVQLASAQSAAAGDLYAPSQPQDSAIGKALLGPPDLDESDNSEWFRQRILDMRRELVRRLEELDKLEEQIREEGQKGK